MRLEEIAGQRMRERRVALGLTQEVAADRITAHLNREWTRQAVSAAEKGKRSFTAAELVAIAHALGTTVAWLLSPPEDVDGIELGAGAYLPSHLLVSALLPHITSGRSLEDVLEAAYQLRIRTQKLEEAAGDVAAGIEVLDQRVAAVAAPVVELDPDEMRAARPVVVVIVTSPRGVLVTKRRDGRPPWGFVSGEVEPGEQPGDAAVREVKEETGLEVAAGRVIGQRVHPATGRGLVYMAAVPPHKTDAFVGDDSELSEVRWVTPAEAERLMPDMFGPVRRYLDAVSRAGAGHGGA